MQEKRSIAIGLGKSKPKEKKNEHAMYKPATHGRQW